MSTRLIDIANISVTSFWGGSKKGKMIQLTNLGGRDYSQLTKDEVEILIKILQDWLKGKEQS